MLMRLLIAIALLAAGFAGGPAASWAHPGPETATHGESHATDHADAGPCAGMGAGVAEGYPSCGAEHGGPAAAGGEGCAVMAACTALPALPAIPTDIASTPLTAEWGPAASEQRPAGRTAEPNLEPPIARL